MNLLATRIAQMATMVAVAQACSNSDTAQESQEAEVRAQEDEVDTEAPLVGNDTNRNDISDEMRMHLQRNCPMLADDVDVDAGLTSTGTTLSFTTETGDVADLRRRVRHMGLTYGTYDGEIEMGWFQLGEASNVADESATDESESITGSSFERMPPVNVAVVNLDTGAQIVLTPTAPDQLGAMQVHTAIHQQHLAAGKCWMPKSPFSGAPATPIKRIDG